MPAVLRALREARGMTQEGWALLLGVSAPTVKRWEGGAAVPTAEAEQVIVDECQARGLFRTYTSGPLAGVTLTSELLRDVLAQARLDRRNSRTEHSGTQGPTAVTGRFASIPVPLTSLIGRDEERVAAVAMLAGGSRLLTLTGPGGVGKTRLAVAVASGLADVFPDGVTFVDLAPLRDPRLVPSTLARAVQLAESGGRSARELLLAHLRERCMLLLLDNFEHLVAAAPLLTELLAGCSRLALLVTSRAALRLRGERLFPVGPLSTPLAERPSVEAIAASPAVRLFVERAQAVAPDFTLGSDAAGAVVAICRRLDGLPLAIELAAAWGRVLSPQALLTRLDEGLPLLSRGARDLPARQQTLRNAIGWSYDLLSPDERTLFRRLAVFAGGFEIEAVEAICVGPELAQDDVLEQLAGLVDRSLVQAADGSGTVRYSLLEPVRQFAAELADAEATAAVAARHAAYFLRLAEQMAPMLRSSEWRYAIARFERELGNLRSALRWANAADALEIEVRLATAFALFLQARSYLSEGRRALGPVLARPAGTIDPALRRRALLADGRLAQWLSDMPAAAALLSECLDAARAADDREVMAEALAYLGLVQMRLGTMPEALAQLHESLALARDLQDDLAAALALMILGVTSLNLADYPRAQALLEEALLLYERNGDTRTGAVVRTELGVLARGRGERDQAAELLRQGLEIHRTVGDQTFMAISIRQIAAVLADPLPQRAARLLGAAEALREVLGTTLPPSDRANDERTLAVIRARLSEPQLASAWAEGRALTLDQAVAEALTGLDETTGAGTRSS